MPSATLPSLRRAGQSGVRTPRGRAGLTAALYAMIVAAGLMPLPGQAAAQPEGARTFTSFSDVRNTVLEAIGTASQRIWLVSDYLTDGEIVSALYVAKYRKIDVQVLLGRAKVNHYMSRLNYLKNQNIPTYLRPDSLKARYPTGVLADQRLVWVDSDLNFLSRVRSFSVMDATEADRAAFEKGFAEAANLKLAAIPSPMPSVGRPNPQGAVYRPPAAGASADASSAASAAGEGYYYGGKSHPKPADVTTKLPRQLKYDRPVRQAPARQPAVTAQPQDSSPTGDAAKSPVPAGEDLHDSIGTSPGAPDLPPAEGG